MEGIERLSVNVECAQFATEHALRLVKRSQTSVRPRRRYEDERFGRITS